MKKFIVIMFVLIGLAAFVAYGFLGVLGTLGLIGCLWLIGNLQERSMKKKSDWRKL